MFDVQVARAMFQYLCSPPHTTQQPPAATAAAAEASSSSNGASSSSNDQQQDAQQLAASFAALKKQRASRVTDEQRQKMYGQLLAEMDALPPVFVRTAQGCEIKPLLGSC